MVPIDGMATLPKTITMLAQMLYEEYLDSCGGLNFQGLPCPTWEALPEAIRTHWERVTRMASELFDVLTAEDRVQLNALADYLRDKDYDGRVTNGLVWAQALDRLLGRAS